jgi:ComF family protein
VFALYRFDRHGPAQELIHQLKYGGLSSLGVVLGRETGAALRAAYPSLRFDGVVPLPLHARRLRERGYNQSMLIAAGVAEVLGVPVVADMVDRPRNTKSQTGLGADDRVANTRDAFALRPGMAPSPGSALLLVDDVLTTGATIAACASVLQPFHPSLLAACTVAAAGVSSGAAGKSVAVR